MHKENKKEDILDLACDLYDEGDYDSSSDISSKLKTHYALCSEELLEYSLKGLETIKV